MILKDKEFKKHTSGLYVSMDGEVFVPRNGKKLEHFTLGSRDRDGYLRVKRNNKEYRVHRLVAECYLPNPSKHPCVNHKDENKQNNEVSNLEWCNVKYNNTYGTRLNSVSNKLSSKVLQFTLNGELVKEWKSTCECGRNGFQQSCISRCCNGESKKHKGYIWKYKEKESA